MAIFTGSGVALVTPFHEDESINYDKLDEMLDYHCTHGTDSIIICGTTGESSTLSEHNDPDVKRGSRRRCRRTAACNTIL